MMNAKWEIVQQCQDRKTRCLPVPGGWLYLVHELDMGSVMGQLMTFVPKPNASLGQDWTVRDMSETVERKDEK
jgi:hypothetical protein